jgi:hypothetical protein
MISCFSFFDIITNNLSVQGFRVQSSTVKVVKVFDFESNAEFIRSLKLAERACTEIKSKNMKK